MLVKSRRQAILRVKPELLGNLFFVNGEKHFVITRGVPEDAKFIGAWYDHMRRCFEIMYESNEFDLVEEGQECPVLEPPIIKRLKEKVK